MIDPESYINKVLNKFKAQREYLLKEIISTFPQDPRIENVTPNEVLEILTIQQEVIHPPYIRNTITIIYKMNKPLK